MINYAIMTSWSHGRDASDKRKGIVATAKKVRPKSPLNSVSLKEELAAALAAHRELGDQYKDHVAAALAERIDFPYRSARAGRNEPNTQAGEVGLRTFLKVAMPVLGFGVPLTIVGAIVAGADGFYVVLAMIFVINLLWLWRSR